MIVRLEAFSKEVIDTMQNAIDANDKQSKKLVFGLYLVILILVAQIPILLLSICFNRSNICFCFTNLIWIANLFLVVAISYVTYF